MNSLSRIKRTIEKQRYKHPRKRKGKLSTPIHPHLHNLTVLSKTKNPKTKTEQIPLSPKNLKTKTPQNYGNSQVLLRRRTNSTKSALNCSVFLRR